MDADEALRAAQKAKGDAEVALGKTEGSAKSAEQALEKAEKALAEDQENWVDHRTSAGFGTDQEYTDALLRPDEKEALSDAIERQKEAMVRVDADIERAAEHTGEKERPDVNRLEELEKAAQAAKNETRDRWTAAKGEAT